jgi:hypothetical protein
MRAKVTIRIYTKFIFYEAGARTVNGAVARRSSGEDGVAGLEENRPARPRIGGGGKFPFNRRNLGASGVLVWRRVKLTVVKIAGIEIRRAARREEEDEVVRRGERMNFYRAAGYL